MAEPSRPFSAWIELVVARSARPAQASLLSVGMLPIAMLANIEATGPRLRGCLTAIDKFGVEIGEVLLERLL